MVRCNMKEFIEKLIGRLEIIAWQPLPQPYKEGCE